MHQLKNCYDIRSTDICPEDAFLIGRAFGSELIERNKKRAVIGYDRRKDSKIIHDHFIEGLLSTGIDVVSVGRAPTPMIQTAEIALNVDAAIAITASHNPPEYNGIKLFMNRRAFSDEHLAQLIGRILQKSFHKGEGKLEHADFSKQYAQILHQVVQISGQFRIGIDFLNGAAADIFPYIASMFKGEYYLLNHNLDHTFGGFAPDPTYEPRLEQLKALILEKNLDFGIVFDGDMDRCVILDNKGKMLPGDALTALYAYFTYKLEGRHIKVIWDSKSSNLFIKWAKSFADCLISITGHCHIYNLLQQSDADLGGECSGHYLFKNHNGISDGLYAAMMFISSLEKLQLTLPKALDLLPAIWVAPPMAIQCLEEDKVRVISQITHILTRQGITLDLSDGVKVCLSCGWWMIRPSRTEEILRLSAEGWTQEGLETVTEHMNTILSSIDLA